ncbi:hypothetical protein NQ314_003296 [Rhamnusium bicolor]|uniref:DDE Tnp4 domain-containing protein n=1 Tax=Rhamnusium bicolor TaxID=1586634 RepID=A0AAV8ZMC8_9CUCU|nr:hypothetical protein NQ314_003296 [Rhamnusium bicolor]
MSEYTENLMLQNVLESSDEFSNIWETSESKDSSSSLSVNLDSSDDNLYKERRKIAKQKNYVENVVLKYDDFQQISEKFDISESAAHTLIKRVVKFVISEKGMDGAIGAIDATHICIKRPQKDAYTYCNRKGQHSVLLQAVCDDKKRFMDVFCGEAGSIHDARDSAYPDLPWLLTPFKDTGNLTRQQKIFNYRHSSARVIVENSFDLLHGRFRRLKFFENNNITFIVECIIATCVLHNICINIDDQQIETDEPFEPGGNVFCPEEFSEEAIALGNNKREELFRKMFPA